MTDGERQDKESAQGTMAQKSTQTKTAVETVKQDESSLNLYGTVL